MWHLGQIYCWHIYGHGMIDKAAVHCLFDLYMYSLGLHVDYIISAVGYTCTEHV